MIYVLTFPERFRFDIEDRPPALPTAHPDAYVEIEAKDEAKARKMAVKCLGHSWSEIKTDEAFDPEYFTHRCVARIWKDPNTGVEMEVTP